MKIKEFLSGIIHKRYFRWYVLAGVSLIVSLAFAIYNLVVGIMFRLVWNFSVSFYYIALMITKLIILRSENKWKSYPQENLNQNRLNLFKIVSIFLLIIDLVLIAPITLLLLQEKRAVNLGMIPTIATATYTTYKIVMACVNYTHSKKSQNLSLHGLKILSLEEAIASIITLQNTMVVAFGNLDDMITLITWTSIGIFLSMLAISVLQFIKLSKLKKANKNPPL